MMSSSWSNFILLIFVMYFPVYKSVTASQDSSGIYSIPAKSVSEADLLQEHSQFMLANMKMSINPCENFYEFACGNWHNNSMVPAMGRNDTFYNAMEVTLDELFVEFLRNTSAIEENSAETKAKRFFASCMNMSADLTQGYKTLHDSLKYPMLGHDKTLDWIALNFYSNYGVNSLLPLFASLNENNLLYEIGIDPPSAILTNPDKFNFTTIFNDFKFINKEEVETELEELKAFEKKLIATTSFLNQTEIETLGEFMARHNSSKVNWKRFFNLAFNGTFKNSWKIHNTVKNFTRLNKFLMKSNVDILFKYVKWLNIMKFYHIWKTETSEKTIESKCREKTLEYFGDALIPWFIETTYDQDRRTDLLLISKRIKDTFYTFLDQYPWLDSETRSEVKSKLRAMDLVVGYTDKMMNRKRMDNEYKDINITNNYWTNLMTLVEKNVWIKLIGTSLIKAIDKTYNVNAWYVFYLNMSFLTVGIAQLPFYHIKLPNSLKFGGIGKVIGHEMVHGFDSNLYSFNYDHKPKNWSEESNRNFKERYQCLESQYNKFIYKGERTNGKRTSGENIADNGGLRIAYHSYIQFLSENSDFESATDKPLPGMDFNNKQLFFLKFAQNYCDGQSTEKQIKKVRFGYHSLNKFRVFSPLMNMPEFSEAFHCALGTFMNPLKKCVVW